MGNEETSQPINFMFDTEREEENEALALNIREIRHRARWEAKMQPDFPLDLIEHNLSQVALALDLPWLELPREDDG